MSSVAADSASAAVTAVRMLGDLASSLYEHGVLLALACEVGQIRDVLAVDDRHDHMPGDADTPGSGSNWARPTLF